MYILTEREEMLCKIIVECAYEVHKRLGPGLLEKIYEACFCYELSKRGVANKRQVSLPIKYDDMIFDEGLRIDVLVDDLIICEIKAVNEINPVWQAQVLSHLKLVNLHVGFLLNFNTSLMKHGTRRYCME